MKLFQTHEFLTAQEIGMRQQWCQDNRDVEIEITFTLPGGSFGILRDLSLDNAIDPQGYYEIDPLELGAEDNVDVEPFQLVWHLEYWPYEFNKVPERDRPNPISIDLDYDNLIVAELLAIARQSWPDWEQDLVQRFRQRYSK